MKAPRGNDYVFAEILFNPNHLRFGIDVMVSNVPSDIQDVIVNGTIIWTQLKNIKEKFQPEHYQLIWVSYYVFIIFLCFLINF